MALPPNQFFAVLTSAESQLYGFIGRMVIDRIGLRAQLVAFVG